MSNDETNGGAEGAVVVAAERAVQIPAAMIYIDQARHLLFGIHNTCQVCTSHTEANVVKVENDFEHTELVTVHEAGCPVAHLVEAWDGLARIIREERAV